MSAPDVRYANSGGLGLGFVDRGVAQLRGVPGDWNLYALDPGTV